MTANTRKVSVLMPTFKHEGFIVRAVRSLLAQTFGDWELIIVDDGSPDRTAEILAPFRADPRVRYLRNPRNLGLGACLNLATAHARGEYLAYLPSDDIYHADHLQRLVDTLDADPGLFLAYGGVQTGISPIFIDDPDWLHGATLQGDDVVGREAEVLGDPQPVDWLHHLKSGNILALVQVMHRRRDTLPWPVRSQLVSDTFEADQWRAYLGRGSQFGYTGTVTCQWVQHPKQRHRIIGGTPDSASRMVGGLAMYRGHYGVGAGEYLNWRPAEGYPIDEAARAATLAVLDRRTAPPEPDPDPLRILVVGDLGFNPERLLALERAGHRLAGLWVTEPEVWMSTGPFAWGHIRDLDPRHWRAEAEAFAPDVIYAGLNWQSMRLAEQVLDAGLDAPFVFHFKEGPGYAYLHGLWPTLARLLRQADGRVYINEECRDWFANAVGGRAGEGIIMDGDLPLASWFAGDFSPKLSDRDGQIHTVCSGRWFGVDDWSQFVAAGVHVHIYGEIFHDLADGIIPAGVRTGYVHLHETVPQERWVAELSQYDAGWLHVFTSDNGGDLASATWSDLNYPGRLATYAAAGLPWILFDNAGRGSVTAIENLARRLDVGVPFTTVADLGRRLSDRSRLRELTANARRHRERFTFEGHLDELVAYFRSLIRARRSGAVPADVMMSHHP
jgi:hypothetical protein